MSITDIFCTPEQGRRLTELVPDLKYKMAWTVVWEDWEYKHIDVTRYTDSMRERKMQHTPALTLQELRDVAKDHVPASDLITKFQPYLYNMTAPKLADWIIERLEAKP